VGKAVTIVAAILTLGVATPVGAQQLAVGDPAPPLAVKAFVKGTPVARLERGKRYVVEFWATWCGPCRATIPHLTALQKKNPQVTFIGVSVWENDPSAVKPFLQEMAGQMAYAVAVDDVPKGAPGNQGKMARTWMQAAGQEGIPTAFLIGGDGKIAWIGHPMALEEPLKQLVAGKWDVAAARSRFQKEQARNRSMRQLQEKLHQASQSGDPKQMIAVVDQAIAQDPEIEPAVGPLKYSLLSRQLKDAEKAQAYGTRLVEVVLKDDAQGLNDFAWGIVAPQAPKADAAGVALALAAAQRADALTEGKNSGIADTLAKAYFDSGDPAKAVEAQERAVRLAKGTPDENNPRLKERLEQYRKAAQSP
jgi:thiol-disulfide isomerase/thioredoxin